ncbi:FecR domain-containing protein [Roseateles sp.]|uniref:FecR domain-containing protein n=1 Tax=Roseateles sp. TaxID=1971397 RepID=UPI0039E777A8
MSHARQDLDHDTLRQAAEWFAVLGAGDAGDGERARWQAWLAERPEHGRAWQRVEAISAQLDLPVEERAAADSALAAAHHVARRRQALKALALLGVSVSAGWAAWKSPSGQSMLAGLGADYRTATGETAEFTLADGSRLWLDTASAADVDLGPALRRIVLQAGRILVETASGMSQAPLVVNTAQGRLHALGTRFCVQQFAAATEVAVYAGRVEARPGDTGAGSRVVQAGEWLRFTSASIGTPQPAMTGGEAWVRGVLLADNLPLPAFLEELARYRHGLLRCDPAVAHLRVAGGYPLRDPDRALSMLEAALPIKVRRRLPGWVVIEAR